MEARLRPLNDANQGLVHRQASKSVFWELEPQLARRVQAEGDPVFEKERWISTMLLNYGTCGYSIVDDSARTATATVLFCQRDLAPGAQAMPSGPVSQDAEIITSLFVDTGFRSIGLEAVLLDAAIMDLTERGASAVEAFGLAMDCTTDDVAALDEEHAEIFEHDRQIGLISEMDLRSAGFEVVAPHPVFPRLRLELPPAQEMMTAEAVEKLLAGLTAPVV